MIGPLSRRLGLLALAVAVLMVAASCGEGPSPVAPNAELAALDVTPGSQLAAVLRAQALSRGVSRSGTIGPEGGSIEAADVVLTVPAGALSEPVHITVTLPAGPFYQVRLAPHGLQFAQPFTLGFHVADLPPRSDLLGAYFLGALSRLFQPAEIFTLTIAAGQAGLQSTHFSGYTLASGRCVVDNTISATASTCTP